MPTQSLSTSKTVSETMDILDENTDRENSGDVSNEDIAASNILELPQKINIGTSTLDIDDLLQQFKSIFSSPNPFALYARLNGIKYKLSNFINDVTAEIVEGFAGESSSSIYALYYESEYHKIILSNMENYLYESKYFDLKFYFEAVVTFDKSKLNLAKGLLKLYKNDKESDIQKFLKTYNEKKISYTKIKKLYEELGMDSIKFDKDEFDEYKIYDFLEKIYFEAGEQKKHILLSAFTLSIENRGFKEIYEIFRKINKGYIDKQFSSRCRNANLYVNTKEFSDLKNKLDILVINYNTSKNGFYEKVRGLIDEQNVEKKYFWWYLKTEIINKYFRKLRRIFYWNLVEKLIVDRLSWNALAGDLNQDEIERFLYSEHSNTFIKRLFGLKNIILQLSNNIWWPFLKPLVYALIIEHLKVDAKSFDKIQFILCFIIPKDYSEYKTIFSFFNEIKTIYGIGSNGTRASTMINILNKVKISASLIILFSLISFILANTAPIGFFISIFLLGICTMIEFLFSNYFSSVRWNLGIKTYLIVASMIFGFTWIINLGHTLQDGQTLLNGISGVNRITASDVVTTENIGKAGKYMADIFGK